MPRKQAACSRLAGHGGDCKSAESLAKRNDRRRQDKLDAAAAVLAACCAEHREAVKGGRACPQHEQWRVLHREQLTWAYRERHPPGAEFGDGYQWSRRSWAAAE